MKWEYPVKHTSRPVLQGTARVDTYIRWFAGGNAYHVSFITDNSALIGIDRIRDVMHRLDGAYPRYYGGLPEHPCLTWETPLG